MKINLVREYSTYTHRHKPEKGVGPIQFPLFLDWDAQALELHKRIIGLCYFDALRGRNWRLEYLKFESGEPYYALFINDALLGKVNVTGSKRLTDIRKALAMYVVAIRLMRKRRAGRINFETATFEIGGAESEEHHARAYILFSVEEEDRERRGIETAG